MGASATDVRRIRYQRDNDTGLGCRVIGYRRRCECGTASPWLSSVQAARAWVEVHRATGHRD